MYPKRGNGFISTSPQPSSLILFSRIAMILVVVLLLVTCLVSQFYIIEAKIVNVKILGRKYWVDVPFIKEKQVPLFEKNFCELTEEEKLMYVNKVASLPPSEGRKHVWDMGKKWLRKQLTESRKSIVEDASEIMDAKIPSDRAYAVVNFVLNHKIVTATSVVGMYYLSKALLGLSPSE